MFLGFNRCVTLQSAACGDAAERDELKASVAELQRQLHQTSLLLADVQDEAARSQGALRDVEAERDEAAGRAARAQSSAAALGVELEEAHAARGSLQQAAELSEWHAVHRGETMRQLLRLGHLLERDFGATGESSTAASSVCTTLSCG